MKPGDRVLCALHGAGVTSYHMETILSVEGDVVWLDNGEGNDPSGPYVDGLKPGPFGFVDEIAEALT